MFSYDEIRVMWLGWELYVSGVIYPFKRCYICLRVLHLEAEVVCMTLFGVINHGRPNSKKTPKISTPNAYTLYNPLPMSGGETVDFTPVIGLC